MKIFTKTIGTFILIGLVCQFIKAQTDRKFFSLEPKKSIEQEISLNQIHTYEIKAEKDQFLSLVIDQKNADISATFLTADRQRLLQIDNPNIHRGPQQILLIIPQTGLYRLEIKARETGRYAVEIESLQTATATDSKRIEAERAFIEGENLSASGSFAQALAKYEASFQIINGLNDAYSEAKILYSLGKTQKALGNIGKATENFAKSLKLFQTAGSWDEIFKNLTPLYLIMGGKQQTFDYLDDALSLVKALKNERLEAILLTALAKVSEDLNQSDKALDFNSQALELFRITGKRGPQVFHLTEIADADLSFEDKKRAVNYLNQAILLSQGASDKSLEVSLLMGIAYIYSSIDEHQQALNYLQKTLPLWREVKDKNGEAYSLNFIGITYSVLGDFELGRDYLAQSLALIQQTNDLRGQAYTISDLGAIESSLGNSDKAFDYYQKALKVFQETGEKNGEAMTTSHLAEIYWIRNDKNKALENFKKSLSIFRSLNSREGEANALINLGFVYEITGDPEKALNNHNQALPIYRLLGSQSGEAMSLYGIARVMYIRGNLEESLTKTEAAIRLIENIRSKIASTELRTSYLANYQQLYKFYIDLLMRINKTKPGQGFDARALQASEHARARSLLDILNEAKVDLRQGLEPALLERERDFQKQINIKAEARKRAKTPTQIEANNKEIRLLTADYQNLKAEIKLKNPHYAALTQPQPIGLKETQQLLDSDTLLLEYSLGEEQSYLWIVSNNSLKTFTLPKRQDIETKALEFYEFIKKPETNPNSPDYASALSRILLDPAATELSNKRLIIVADGLLQYVPFAALPNPIEPLIVKHEIIYLPSASTLAVLRDETMGRKPAPKTLAVLADPVFDANDTRVNLAPPTGKIYANSSLQKATREAGFNDSLPLPRLPATRYEAKTILSLVANTEKKQAIDFEANLATINSQEMSNYRIIHFATHGFLNSQNPELSGIVLSLVDQKGQSREGFLRLQEIYNLKLPADLIVLSACQTALGKDVKGEGLIGLTRGFMYAGAPRVVASLWAVDDQATSELMKLFYQGMLGENKLRPAAALREAQIAMWKSKRFNPAYFWSAFTIQGEWR